MSRIAGVRLLLRTHPGVLVPALLASLLAVVGAALTVPQAQEGVLSPTPVVATTGATNEVAGLASAPVALDLPGAGALIGVIPVGLDEEGVLELPPDPRTSGWYRPLGPVGGAGADVLVQRAPSPALLALRYADPVALVLGPERVLVGSGSTRTYGTTTPAPLHYRVTSVTHYPGGRAPLAGLFDPSGPERLVIVALGGPPGEPSAARADDVVVVAAPA